MNAPRHDPDELKAALEALADALRIDHELLEQRERVTRQIGAHAHVLIKARNAAARVLRREGGTVTYGDQFWSVDHNGYVTCQPVRVNLDAIEEVRKHGETKLQLTPPPSEETPA